MKKIIISEEALKRLTEIDWEGDFQDVKKSCMNLNTLVDYLNKVRANAPITKTSDREKFPVTKPFVHSKSTFFKGDWEQGDLSVDVDEFIKRMTAPPKSIISMNAKMTKSGGRYTTVYNTGIPAFRGLVYDQDKDKFFIINTCPGAGKCVSICYALKGNYIRWTRYDEFTRRLNYLLNHPKKFKMQMYKEIKEVAEKNDAYKGYKPQIIIRHNDSGDFFTNKYVEIASSVIKKLQEEGYNVRDYAYTKVADVALDDTLANTTFSKGGNVKQDRKGKDAEKLSFIVPKGLVTGLNVMKLADERKMKENIADFFDIDVNTILSYDELIDKIDRGNPKWNVIVTNRDGDDAAFRNDVKGIYLIEH